MRVHDLHAHCRGVTVSTSALFIAAVTFLYLCGGVSAVMEGNWKLALLLAGYVVANAALMVGAGDIS